MFTSYLTKNTMIFIVKRDHLIYFVWGDYNNTKVYSKLAISPLGPAGLSLYVYCKIVPHLSSTPWFINFQLSGKWDMQTILPVVECFCYLQLGPQTNVTILALETQQWVVLRIVNVQVSQSAWNLLIFLCKMPDVFVWFEPDSNFLCIFY